VKPSSLAPVPGRPRVAVIGAGFSGIAAGVALRRRGIEDFVIFDKFPDLGGTWFANRYPGAEVDLESHIYSFSFEHSDWTRTHVEWHELLDYLRRVATKWDLVDRMRLGEKVESVTWSDDDRTWSVTTDSGVDHGRFSAVISAVGFLNVPLIPPFARGETEFEGVMCHTSTWPEGLDLAGKRVAVLGTGSSAVQIIVEAAAVASDVTIFQIEPNWILPKGSRAFTPEERKASRNPLVYRWKRFKLYLDYDLRQARTQHARVDGAAHRKRRAASLEYLQQSLADRPDLIEVCTPDFPFEGRRTVISDTYYPTLKLPHVHLVPHAVKGMTRTGVVDANGDEHDVDVVIFATGFDAANYLQSFRVTGANGADLQEVWKGEPEALLGMMVPGFPNFFMMYGPNTNAVPLVSFYEAQASFAAALIAKLKDPAKKVVAVKPDAFRRFNDKLQQQLSRTVWAETASYFKAGTGKVVSQWPFSATSYIVGTKVARFRDVEVS
jgi:cation diffusion facilitator CzcD-associated flavoprotein CzcO